MKIRLFVNKQVLVNREIYSKIKSFKMDVPKEFLKFIMLSKYIEKGAVCIEGFEELEENKDENT